METWTAIYRDWYIVETIWNHYCPQSCLRPIDWCQCRVCHVTILLPVWRFWYFGVIWTVENVPTVMSPVVGHAESWDIGGPVLGVTALPASTPITPMLLWQPGSPQTKHPRCGRDEMPRGWRSELGRRSPKNDLPFPHPNPGDWYTMPDWAEFSWRPKLCGRPKTWRLSIPSICTTVDSAKSGCCFVVIVCIAAGITISPTHWSCDCARWLWATGVSWWPATVKPLTWRVARVLQSAHGRT